MKKNLWIEIGHKSIRYDHLVSIGYDCKKEFCVFYVEMTGNGRREEFMEILMTDLFSQNDDPEQLCLLLQKVLHDMELAIDCALAECTDTLNLVDVCGNAVASRFRRCHFRQLQSKN